jgi:hypothetical protein
MKVRQLYQLSVAVTLGMLFSILGGPQVACEERSEGDDLFGRNLKDWQRSGNGKNPWTLTTSGVLGCTAATDSMTFDQHLGDGTLYLQWRFPPGDPKATPTASITVRGGEGEHVVRINLGTNPGELATTIIASSDRLRTLTTPPGKNVAKKVGEWNSMKVVMKDKEVVVTVNGEQVTSTTDSPNETGYFALNAAGHAVEFRDVRWKAAK